MLTLTTQHAHTHINTNMFRIPSTPKLLLYLSCSSPTQRNPQRERAREILIYVIPIVMESKGDSPTKSPDEIHLSHWVNNTHTQILTLNDEQELNFALKHEKENACKIINTIQTKNVCHGYPKKSGGCPLLPGSL